MNVLHRILFRTRSERLSRGVPGVFVARLSGRRRGLGFLCVCFALTGGASAKAADSEPQGPLRVGFSYEVPRSCMSEEQAFSLVHRRSRRVQRVQEQEAPQLLRMEVVRTGGGYRGVLSVVRVGEEPETRAMTGDGCDEVVEALALTAALSLDPHATLTLGPARAEKEETAVEAAVVEPAQDERRRSEESSEATPGVEPVWEWATGGSFSVGRMMREELHGGPGLMLSLSEPSARSFLPVEWRLAVNAYWPLSSQPQPNIVTRGAQMRLAYCALRFGQELSLLLCPAGGVGLLFAQARGFESEQRATRFTAQLGGQARVRARVSAHLQFWLATGGQVYLTQREFAVAPGPEVLSSSSAVGWNGALGAAWVF